ncbi:MAG: cation:proton antiporter [Patescibacteria group bacterium]|nr:cation:proton antiporter [Patescibacteria group bacterium]
MEGIILELAATVVLVTILSIFARMLKQPFILAYLAAGVLIASFGFFNLTDHETFKLFSDLGIMFLLFLVGLEINYSSLKLVGKVSIILGLGQIIFTSLFGYIIASIFGYDWLASLYIAVALTFSSTIIIVKLLSDKKELRSLHGKISVGMLLVQDAVAVIILVLLSGLTDGNNAGLAEIILTLLKGTILVFVTLWVGKRIIPAIFDRLAKSQELLFIASLAWVLGMAVIVSYMGFSIEIAGFLAGLALSNSLERLQISNKIRSLRDFFIVLFFVLLGASMALSDLSGLTLPIIVFSLFVLIGNPIIVLSILGFLGYRKRTGLLTGLTVAQISEFSLIVAAVGLKLGHIDNSTVTLITGVGIITITISTYLIINADKLYKFLANLLSIFETRRIKEPVLKKQRKRKYVLIGCHRTGMGIASLLPKNQLLIIEFDPDMVHKLNKQGYNVLFGDITDPDILDDMLVTNADVLIITSPDIQDNLSVLEMYKQKSKRPTIIVRAQSKEELEILYDNGADYVLLPHLTAGQILGHMITSKNLENGIRHMRKKEMEAIQL